VKIVDGSVLSLAVGERIYYADEMGAYSLGLDGTDKTLLREGHIRHMALYGGSLYLFEMTEDGGRIVICDLHGTELKVVTENCTGGMNVTAKGVYYLNNEGIFFLPHGDNGKLKQLIFADGVSGLNAVEGGVYYISSSLGEPSLNQYQGQQARTVIPPSVLGELENGPFVVGSRIYFYAGGTLQSTDLTGKDLQQVKTE
jgi:hypothetical protein